MTELSSGAQKSDLWGQPRGLTYLFGSEMWERFSYYGMRSLLVLYMLQYLLKPENVTHVMGLVSLRAGLEWIFGALNDQAFASQIYGFYTGFVYLTPILGGILADRVIGRTPTVVLGAALMVLGHFLMAYDRLFLVALLLLILGNGAFKPNITTQVGELYSPNDPRVDRAYSIFYVGINIGAFFSPLVCGYLGERIAWHYGFASAGVGMAIGLATYLAGARYLPKQAAITSPANEPEPAPVSKRQALMVLAALFIPSAFFWAAYEQQGNTIAVLIARSVDRSANLLVWQGEIPVTWFQSINPILIFAITPILVALWSRLADARREPPTISKLWIGCGLTALAYVVIAAVAYASTTHHVSWVWLLPYFLLLTIGELHFSPIGLSLVSHVAPKGSRSLIMAIWFSSIFVGNMLAGWIGSLWPKFSSPTFFLLVAGVAGAAVVVILVVRRVFRSALASV